MKVLGVDISMNNLGLSLGELDDHTLALSFTELITIKTKKDGKFIKQFNQRMDDLRRARLLVEGFREMEEKCEIIFVELPHGSQSSRAMTSYGMSIMLMAYTLKPVIVVTPNQVKVVATHYGEASKKEMVKWASDKYPNATWKKSKAGVIYENNEHNADAIAAVEAGILLDSFVNAKIMMEYL